MHQAYGVGSCLALTVCLLLAPTWGAPLEDVDSLMGDAYAVDDHQGSTSLPPTPSHQPLFSPQAPFVLTVDLPPDFLDVETSPTLYPPYHRPSPPPQPPPPSLIDTIILRWNLFLETLCNLYADFLTWLTTTAKSFLQAFSDFANDPVEYTKEHPLMMLIMGGYIIVYLVGLTLVVGVWKRYVLWYLAAGFAVPVAGSFLAWAQSTWYAPYIAAAVVFAGLQIWGVCIRRRRRARLRRRLRVVEDLSED